MLRLLLSLHGRTTADCDYSPRRSTDEATSRLFRCVRFVSENLVRPKSECMLVHVEPGVLRSALSSIVAVGFYACRAREESTIDHSTAREAMSHCAISTLQLWNIDQVVEVDDDECSRMMRRANVRGLCGGRCSRLVSMVGAIARPYNDTCTCGLFHELTRHLTNEFYLVDILPLPSR